MVAFGSPTPLPSWGLTVHSISPAPGEVYRKKGPACARRSTAFASRGAWAPSAVRMVSAGLPIDASVRPLTDQFMLYAYARLGAVVQDRMPPTWPLLMYGCTPASHQAPLTMSTAGGYTSSKSWLYIENAIPICF